MIASNSAPASFFKSYAHSIHTVYCLWHRYAVYDAIWKETIAKNFKTEIYRIWAQKIPFKAIRQAKLCFWIDATSGPSRQFGAPFGSVGPPQLGLWGAAATALYTVYVVSVEVWKTIFHSIFQIFHCIPFWASSIIHTKILLPFHTHFSFHSIP